MTTREHPLSHLYAEKKLDTLLSQAHNVVLQHLLAGNTSFTETDQDAISAVASRHETAHGKTYGLATAKNT